MESEPKKKDNKRLSVERIYQKKSQLEHILLRPDSYIGSTEPATQPMWVWDSSNSAIVSKATTFTPGLYKIFDEILVNAADNKQRDPRMNLIKINIDAEKNTISIWNNGRGIPIEMHKVEKLYVPSMIFGHLLTSSNYDDSEKKVTGGRNGFGAKLCNIFSTKFTVETVCEGKKFKQSWRSNMGKADETKITECSGTDYTCITFQPDLQRFKMETLDTDTIALFTRRAYDMAGCCRGVNVMLNGEKLKIKTFKDYVQLYITGAMIGKGKDLGEGMPGLEPPKIVHEIVNPRWEIAITTSEAGFQQSSFVNSIATTKGGTHVDHVVSQVTEKLLVAVQKKLGKGGMKVKPFQIKSHMWVFVNCLIENPTFDSQTKENMTLRDISFGSKCELNDKYVKDVTNCGILDNILSWVKFKSEKELNKKTSAQKHSKLKGIPKLDDANDAGTKNSRDCTLIVTEGDSAKALAVAGLGVIGRDKYGVFPLKGKMLNVRDASHKQIMENQEIGNLLKIIGLVFGKKYETEADLKSLRYGHLMIMADQDLDGSHIKGLVINFIHASWPGLLKLDFLEEFITPIVKVTKGNQTESFFSLPEFEEWKRETHNSKSWKTKYYKGLGSSTSKEGKEYFSNLRRHRIKFEYDGPASDQAIVMAFGKKNVNERKNWLTNGMEERKMRKEAGLPEVYLYEKDTRSVTYREFINKELILFSNNDNERSIPSLVDGLKPGQRKVIFTVLKRKDKNEVKVAQLAGSVAEMSAYHHGEMSLMTTIINLAQNFVGSNNLNLLQPIGQFGTRLQGGKDHASPRYIFTMMSPLTRLIFHPDDDPLLDYLTDDNQRIEPEWYCPIIPMVLVNGAEGIGTGYSTKIPNYDVRTIIANLRRMIAGEEPVDMIPSYKNFKGEISQIERYRYSVVGNVSVVDETTVVVDELPVRTWTHSYKESVMDIALYGNDKSPAFITDYKEHHTDTTVKFEATLTEAKLQELEQSGLHSKFKLESSIATSSMMLFDKLGVLKKYDTVMDILKEFFTIRQEKYVERKNFLMGMLTAECTKLEMQARFILEKIEGKIVIENRAKRDVHTTLIERGFVGDPVKEWKATQERLQALHDDDDDQTKGAPSEVASTTSTSAGGPDFSYLLSMAIMSLSKEKKDALLKERDEKRAELEALKLKTPNDLWTDDLDILSEQLDIVEEQERLDEADSARLSKKSSKSAKGQAIKKPEVKSKDIKKAFEKAAKDPKKESIKKVEQDWDYKPDVKPEEENSNAPSEAGSEAPSEPEVLSLADRLKKNFASSGSSSGIPQVEPKSTAEPAKKKQTTLTFGKKAAESKKAAPKKKKSAWEISDDSDEDDEDFKASDIDEEPAPLPKREKVGGRAAATTKKKYTVSDDDTDEDDIDEDSSLGKKSDSEDDDDFQPEPKKSKKAAVAVDSDEDNEQVASTRALIEKLSPMKKQPETSKPAAKPKQSKLTFEPKKKAEQSSSQSGEDGTSQSQDAAIEVVDSQESAVSSQASSTASKKAPAKKKETVPKEKKTAPKKASAATKRKPDSDDEEEVKATKSKKPPAKKAPAKKRKSKSDDENSSDSDDDLGKATKSKATKSKAVAKSKAKPKKKQRKDSDSDDDDSFRVDPEEARHVSEVAPRAQRGGRVTAATNKPKYSFSSDEDEDDSDSDF